MEIRKPRRYIDGLDLDFLQSGAQLSRARQDGDTAGALHTGAPRRTQAAQAAERLSSLEDWPSRHCQESRDGDGLRADELAFQPRLAVRKQHLDHLAGFRLSSSRVSPWE
jgi:hypothetical protein